MRSAKLDEALDVLIVGAGLSGIGAAYHLQTKLPSLRVAIVEARARLGGTWDLFRYPGIRSDSDMYTLGYPFRPWRPADGQSIADGASILRYLQDTAHAFGIDAQIHYETRVIRAQWRSADRRWIVTLDQGGKEIQLRTRFLFFCSGYYRYDQGFMPRFEGAELFRGALVHPQHWPEDLQVEGKEIVVIGSGATAVTLVPALAAAGAAHVTMLQRSPTYIVSVPAKEPLRKLPSPALRAKNIALGMGFYQLARRAPALTKRLLIQRAQAELRGATGAAIADFTPDYDPWDQRVCAVPDGDLFAAIRAGKASIVTDHIRNFDESGIALRSGKRLNAALIISATGLNLQFLGGAQIVVDDQIIDVSKHLAYRGAMLSEIPNLAMAIGYTNASWTLKSDLTCAFVCRLLAAMEARGAEGATPRAGQTRGEEPLMGLRSGYVMRAIDRFPKQAAHEPWRVHQNYARDLLSLQRSSIDDGVMELR